ncbi:MAG: hypothetical protein GQ565_07260 [Candidatus Aegiribacteria sp.]|nr:hypothetical protein [Candidatus Aegiribacteria sp.]
MWELVPSARKQIICLKIEDIFCPFLFFLIEQKSFSKKGKISMLSRYRTKGDRPALPVSLSSVISILLILRLAER